MNQYQVWNQDSVTGMREHVADQSVDLVFTDPPYGIRGDQLDQLYHRDESHVVPGYVEVPLETYDQFSRDWITECARVLRPGGSLYIVSGYTNLHHILNALHGTDLEEINHIIAQYSFGVSTKKKWVSSHYHVLFWTKPERGSQKRIFNTNVFYTDQKDSYHDRLTVQPMPRDYKPGEIKNKNQLSEDFIKKFLLYSSRRGDTVLDPFCGGFTTGRTALRFGRKFLGFELNQHAYDQFLPTLDSVQPEPDPVPESPDAEELAKREKMREGWRRDRQRRRDQG
jgi:site-specific DNA-methyltransferase (adenine-specific)